jgi:hypothetical protein
MPDIHTDGPESPDTSSGTLGTIHPITAPAASPETGVHYTDGPGAPQVAASSFKYAYSQGFYGMYLFGG